MAATVKIRLDGLKRLQAAVSNGNLGQPVLKALAEMQEENIARNWSGVQPPRSSPGEPPAVDTGELAKSIQQELRGDHEVAVLTDVAHGLYLEYGTRNMAARPWMLPAAEQVKQQIGQIPALANRVIVQVVGYM